MKIIPVASPHAVAPQAAAAPSSSASARATAIAMLTQQPPQPVVQSQNAVTPEEMSAIQPKSGQSDTLEASTPAETPVEATPPPEKVEDPALSRQFAQLARQEKALRAKAQQQEQAMKAREEAIAAREAEIAAQLESKYKTNYIDKTQLKQNTLQILAEQGISYEELTQQILNQQPVDPRMEATVNSLKAQIEELKQANENTKKAQADQQSQAYQAAVKQIKTDITTLVKSDPAYELVRATNSINDVVELITQTYDKDGVLLTNEEALEQVENYLVEETLKLTNAQKIKKMQEAAQSKAQASQAKPQATSTPQQPQMKTLTNANTSTRKLSAKERAMLAFKNELKTS
jgi:hypothetical protein